MQRKLGTNSQIENLLNSHCSEIYRDTLPGFTISHSLYGMVVLPEKPCRKRISGSPKVCIVGVDCCSK